MAFGLAAIILILNISRLAILMHDEYLNKAFDQITTSSKLKAERGSIYDSSMNTLARTRTTWRVFVSPKAIKKFASDNPGAKERIASGLAEIFKLSEDDILRKISDTSKLDVTIKSAASESEYKTLVEFISQSGFDDLIFTEAQSARYYPRGTLAAHALGFTGSDNQGLYGLEYYYNDLLTGKDGYYLYAKDAGGNAMPGGYTELVEPQDGYSLVTTIDSYIQSELEAQLSTIVTNHMVTNRAAGIVMDTKTGAILAMATSSPFDPNSPFVLDDLSMQKLEGSGLTPGSDEYNAEKTRLMQIMWSNKAVSEAYEPGSTFKIITVAAALDSGSATMHDHFSCNGYTTIGGYRIKCHKTTGHGSGFTLAYGLQMSCNPTMMAIAERTGSETFYSYVEKFGYLEKSGIDLPSEAVTIFHSPDSIGSTELATASFGQRFKISIINHLTAISAVANGGYLVEPYIVDSVIDSYGNVIQKHGTVIKNQVISKNVAMDIAKALEEGVSGDGGAKNAYVEGYSIAAKTGTSQKFDILDENGNSYLRIGSTVAFAPYDESGIAVIIVVDEPQSSVKYGSTVAAPYISALLEKVLPYLEYDRVTPDTTFETENYVGMNVSSAKERLTASGVAVSVIGDGNVVLSQIPAHGITLSPALSTVYLYTAEANPEYVSVPSLIGLSAEMANSLAINSGLNIKIRGVTDKFSDYLSVVSQSIPPGTSVRRGEVIELTLLRTDFED